METMPLELGQRRGSVRPKQQPAPDIAAILDAAFDAARAAIPGWRIGAQPTAAMVRGMVAWLEAHGCENIIRKVKPWSACASAAPAMLRKARGHDDGRAEGCAAQQ